MTETDDQTRWVTSRLVVGRAPTDVTGIFVDAVEPAEALRLLRLGATVVVPNFSLAEQVLRLAGRNERAIAFDIAVGQGQVAWDGDF